MKIIKSSGKKTHLLDPEKTAKTGRGFPVGACGFYGDSRNVTEGTPTCTRCLRINKKKEGAHV